MSDYDLGRAKGTIELTYDASGGRKAKKGLDDIGASAKQTQHDLQSLAKASGIAAGVIGAGLVYAANKAIDFEHQISAIGAVSGASEAQLEALRKKALQLGADTVFSASDAARAMEELVKAGLSLTDVLDGAADATVALAAAGGVDLAEAAAIASNAMNVFSIKARDMGHVVDLIAGAANSSAIDVSEFGFALQQAGAVAALQGVTFDDLTTAIALMGNAGIKGSDAGTSLKTMLSNLQPVTKRQIDLFKALGIVTKDGTNRFYDARGSLRSLSEVAGVLSSVTSEMTAQQKALTLEMIFGSDAIRAAAILTKAGAAGFDEMAASIGKVTAKDVAAKRLDNVKGALEQLKGSVETAAIALGTALLPTIRAVTEFITKLVNKFSALDPRWQKLIAFAAVAAAVLLGLVAAVAAIGAVIAGLVASAGVLKFAAIIVGIIAAVALLVAAFKKLWAESEGFRSLIASIVKVAKTLGAFLLEIFHMVVGFIKSDVIPGVLKLRDSFKKSLEPAFKSAAKFIEERVMPAVKQLTDAIKTAMPTILAISRILFKVLFKALEIVGKVLGWLIPIIFKLAGPMFSLLINVLSWLISNIPTFVKYLVAIGKVLFTIGNIIAIAVIAPLWALWKAGQFVFGAIQAIVKKFVAFFKAVWGVIGEPVKAVFDLIVSIIRLAFEIIGAIVAVAWAILKAIFDTAMAVFAEPVRKAFKAVVDFVKAAMNLISSIISAIWNAIVKVWNAAVTFLAPIVDKAFKAVRNFISQYMGAVRVIISTIWEAIKTIVKAAVDKIVAIIGGVKVVVDKIKGFFSQLKAAADAGIGPLIGLVKGIPGRIASALGGLGNLLYNAGRAIVQGLVDGIWSMWGKLWNVGEGLVNMIAGWLPGSPAKRGPFSGKGYVLLRGERISEDLAQGIMNTAGQAQKALSSMVSELAAGLPIDHSVSVSGAVRSFAPASASKLSAQANQQASRTLNVAAINLNGVWDFTDPTVARKIIANIHGALDDYEREYK